MEEPNVALTVQIGDFLDQLLKDAPELFGKFLAIANEWYKLQITPPAPVKPADGPEHFIIGGTASIQSVGISTEDIDAIVKGYAEATKKEKAIEYLKGFLTGFMLRGA